MQEGDICGQQASGLGRRALAWSERFWATTMIRYPGVVVTSGLLAIDPAPANRLCLVATLSSPSRCETCCSSASPSLPTRASTLVTIEPAWLTLVFTGLLCNALFLRTLHDHAFWSPRLPIIAVRTAGSIVRAPQPQEAHIPLNHCAIQS